METGNQSNRRRGFAVVVALAVVAGIVLLLSGRTTLPLILQALVVIVVAILGIAWAAGRQRSSLAAAMAAAVITALLAGGTAIATFATSADQAYSKGFIKARLTGDASAYYRGVPDDELPRDAESPVDPAVKRAVDGQTNVTPPSRPAGDSDAPREKPSSTRERRLVLPTSASVEAVVWNPTQAGRVLYVVGSTLPPALIAVVALLAMRIIRRARSGDPFSPDNARTLRGLGWTLALGLPLLALTRAAASELATDGTYGAIGTLPQGGDWSFSFASLLPGIGVLALAHIWHEGVRLREIDRTTV